MFQMDCSKTDKTLTTLKCKRSHISLRLYPNTSKIPFLCEIKTQVKHKHIPLVCLHLSTDILAGVKDSACYAPALYASGPTHAWCAPQGSGPPPGGVQHSPSSFICSGQ